jgi:3-oxoacyl-(acyl-carrier-protein) synthase
MVSAHVATQLGLKGPNSTIMTDWCAGLQAVGEAARLVAAGEAEVVLAGGAECGTLPLVLGSYRSSGLFAPFEERPGPFVLGEGAAFLVVEEREHARARGATPIAEIAGAASSAAAEGGGSAALERAVAAALAEAGFASAEVEAVAASTAPSARFRHEEREALRRVFGSGAETIAVASAAPRLGFALAATAPSDLVLLLHSLRSKSPVSRALATSLGFLGQAASVAMRVERNFS